MALCAVCKDPIKYDQECVWVDHEKGVYACMTCEGELKKKVRVLKLTFAGAGWLGFEMKEDCQGLLEEILSLAENSEPGDELTIRIEDLPKHEVLCWPEFPGW
jgi:hypothetical protein